MTKTPITVGIPTFGRGLRVRETLERLAVCDPLPAEVIVHVDQSDGRTERELGSRYPTLRIISSRQRVGPGGGRHRCIQATTQAFFASFDDDSWPVDRDFFAQLMALFESHPRAAVLAASIYRPGEPQPIRTDEVKTTTDYIGCGYAIRTEAYRQTLGHIDRPICYGIEEVDLSMQLHAIGWNVLHCSGLRVYHNTRLGHHSRPDVVASSLQNIALRAFLRYPVSLWPRAFLEFGNTVLFMIKKRRICGLGRGFLGIPATLSQYSSQRQHLPAAKLRSYFKARP